MLLCLLLFNLLTVAAQEPLLRHAYLGVRYPSMQRGKVHYSFSCKVLQKS